ncbi:hypothetical protein pb186bvf_010108 [Paramecium bursaria]
MLKFLENRDPPRPRRLPDKMQNLSNSHLPLNKFFASPLHRDLGEDKTHYYIFKKLPPIETYNPLTEQKRSVERPEYIIKQKDLYKPKYIEELKKGFRKKTGIFEGYLDLINKNKPLLDIHLKLKLPKIPETKRRTNTNRSLDPNSNTSRFTNQSKQKSIVSSHLPEEFNQLQSEHQFKPIKKTFEQKFDDFLISRQDKEIMMRQLSDFDKKIKELKDNLNQM